MYEVEVKVPADLESIRERLDELGATPHGVVAQVDTYYDAPHRSFPDTDEALRIRSERLADAADETRLTYKGPLLDDDSKSREEIETAVADGEKADGILAHLGFEPAATVRKERERFALDGYTITLDSVEDVGEYVEVEREVANEADLDSAREGAFEVLDRLELDPEAQIRTSYLGLLLESRS
jgi:adenylate cyclase, class 2